MLFVISAVFVLVVAGTAAGSGVLPAASALPCPDGSQTCGPQPTQDPGPTQGNQVPTTAPQAPQTTIPPNGDTGAPSAPTQGGNGFQGTVQSMPTPDNPNGCIVNCGPTVTQVPPRTTNPAEVTVTTRPTTTRSSDVTAREVVASTRQITMSQQPPDYQPRTFSACPPGKDRWDDAVLKPYTSFYVTSGSKVFPDTYIRLQCGFHNDDTDKGMGLRHIGKRHEGQWEDLARMSGRSWRYLLDEAIDATLRDPDSYCYDPSNNTWKFQRDLFFIMKDKVIESQGLKRAVVIVSPDFKTIMTAFPSSTDRCAGL